MSVITTENIFDLDPTISAEFIIDGQYASHSMYQEEFRMDWNKIREHALDNSGRVQLSYFTTVPRDQGTPFPARKLIDFLELNGFIVHERKVQTTTDSETGRLRMDRDMSLDVAIHALTKGMNRAVHHVILLAENPIYVSLVKALQNMGVRVTVVGVERTSGDLRRAANEFIDISSIEFKNLFASKD